MNPIRDTFLLNTRYNVIKPNFGKLSEFMGPAR